MKLSKLAFATALIGVSCSLSLNAAQSTDVQDVVKAGQKINQSAEKSQHKIDKISDQIQTKLQQFKTVNKEIDGLNVYNVQMQKQIDNQLAELADIANSMEQVSIIERQISPLMARMISTLEAFVALDVPFLPEERAQRLASLNSMMERADIAVSEKFRRVLEAYQIEVDYGRTIEAYSGLLTIDGQEQNVEFLRIGRVSFLYQTRDGSNLGLWNAESKSWEALPASYRSDLNKAFRIARKQLAPDLVIVPLNVSE
ncbi:DUF3450 domain-containing protein [Thalassotalea sp. LPB0316]|uniref:DUF3450 domain-containing protein n=1 Tax=Thalassotalea sp. LPB0316 TaxID=2769490 RepID=UPI0018674A37|nr:DUF3450 domain-containing protein [Thalassotalea sp. LPB0316]QOL25421.1 DUF3450 domain-containing protein [Thalassotalea sp. LPB0316]